MKKITIAISLFLTLTNLCYAGSTLKDSGFVQFGLCLSRTNERAFSFLDRMETRYDVPLLSDIKPYLGLVNHPFRFSSEFFSNHNYEFNRYYTQAEVTNAVWHGENYAQVMEECFQRFGKSKWINLKNRMPESIRNIPWLFGTGYHFASWCLADRFTTTLQPVYGYERIYPDDERNSISRFAGGIRVEGGYSSSLHYMMDFRDYTESGNGPYTSRDKLYEDRWALVGVKPENSTSYNISESCFQYYTKDLSIAAGRGIFHWGPGEFGSLFLNSKIPPFDYIRLDGVLESSNSANSINYTFLHGFLQSNLPAETLYINSDGRPRTLNCQKYLSAQRLEIRPRKNLLLGFSQGVVYGDRGVQLGYLTPLNFLYSVQHANDDKDNFILSLDGKWRITNGFKVYGEAFFDDILVRDLLKSTGNNKSAYTVGAHWIMPRQFLEKFDLRAEYTKIRPFVYSHVFSSNVYTHWTSPLGYSKEPNSEYYKVELRGTFFPLQASIYASRQNHGENLDRSTDSLTWNVGGDIYQPLYGSHNELYPFLAGKLERTDRIGIKVDYELLENLYLYAEAIHVKKTQEKKRIESFFGFSWNL